MWYFISFIFGGLFGVVFMCLFQINKGLSQEEHRLLNEKKLEKD